MRDEKPKVSVIIPTYNRVHLIGRAIQSVLEQSYQDFEIIVVDDASTDNTGEVVRSLKDERIRYIRHEKNKGAAAARNTGIKVARGEYIAFQDSDDEWLPEKLEKQMKAFDNAPPEVGVVYTDMQRINEDGGIEYWHSPRILPEDGIIYKDALDYRVMNIGIQSAVIKKECFDKVGMFDERFPRFIDLELFIRLSKYYYF
ncbi:glycosyltransferase, partial [candidate division WOR-3 bacterium]|nr:glycosyltransferase [candidate division WOR-3 bacterium]